MCLTFFSVWCLSSLYYVYETFRSLPTKQWAHSDHHVCVWLSFVWCLSSLYYVYETFRSLLVKHWAHSDWHTDFGNCLFWFTCKQIPMIDLISDWKIQSGKTEGQNVLNLIHKVNDFISRSSETNVFFKTSVLNILIKFLIKHLW